MNRNLVWSLLLAALPFLAICASVPLWDRVYPLILGLPFNLAWLIAWIPLTSLCMAGVYRHWKLAHEHRTDATRMAASQAGKGQTP